MDRALQHSTRAAISAGTLQVAEQNYRARRINFYLPTISINGALPSYQVDQSYKFFGASARKRLYKTSDLNFTSFVKLEQSLFTGGNLVATANLASTKNRYPNTGLESVSDAFLDERSERGYFDFTFQQPILKPSAPRNELAEGGDNLALAEITRTEEDVLLRVEVTNAYLDLLLAKTGLEMQSSNLEAARLQAQIDSTKWQDAVLTKEEYLLSATAELDAELAYRDALAKAAEGQRKLALLLETDPAEPVEAFDPAAPAPLGDEEVEERIQAWDRTLAVRRAEIERRRAIRSARFASTGKGLTGDFTAGYSSGRGEIRLEGFPDEPIDTEGWGVSLNFSYPLWDGGSGDAAVEATRVAADRTQLELSKVKQEERAAILRLVNQIGIGYRRLEILRTQIELAREGVDIATRRFAEGRISSIQLAAARVRFLESRVKYLTELKTHLANRIQLDGKFAGNEEPWASRPATNP